MMRLVELGENPSDCWRWIGSVNKRTGYGKKQYMGRSELAHRWIYMQLFGPIPAGGVIDHKCRNRACVNPYHLEVVTIAENVRRGIGTKLTAEKVSELRERMKSMKWGDRKRIANDFGISPQLISDIKYGRAWLQP